MSSDHDQTPAEEVAPPDSDALVADARQAKSWPLVVGALMLIAVPAAIGFGLMRGDSANNAANAVAAESAADSGMGGGMSGSDDVDEVGVLPFSHIQQTDIVIEADPTGAGAVLNVETTIDVACSVSFGPTAQFGSIATDTDMAGGGHSVHQPLMKGLTPGVTYFYRVSATGPDATLYQSRTMQFVYTPSSDGEATEPPQAVDPPAPNVADTAQVVDFSSEYSDSFAAGNAIDGDRSTEWSSAGDGDDTFITLRFSDLMVVEGVGFRTREMTDGTAITLSFSVTVDNGTTYGPFAAGPGLAVGLADFSGYELRFDVETSTGGNTGAIEVEVYGEAEM